jgi:lipopolysaccharide export system protein LptA
MAAATLAAGLIAFGGTAALAQTKIDNAYDTSLPIEITADALEVQQDPGVAVFRGNVDAVQGDMNLRADQLTVHYRQGADSPNSISLIQADGNVFLSSPTEMAQGSQGIYNVDADTLELVGSVVLTRGESVIRGNRLVLNLATGKSKMESGAAKTGTRERVRALFVPNATKKP